MKNLIKKILKEEFDEKDFSWVEDAGLEDIKLGQHFTKSDICTEKNKNCKISITDDSFVIRLDVDDWIDNFIFKGSRDDWYLKSLVMGSNFDTGYELDTDEFNYIYYSLSTENRDKLKSVMEILGIDVRENEYRDNLLTIFDEFESILPATNMVYEVVGVLSSALEKNRNIALREAYKDIVNKSDAKIEYEGGWRHSDVIITIPGNYVLEKIGKGLDLSQILEMIGDDFDFDWGDIYYDSYDTSGREDDVDWIVGSYLDDLLNELESEDGFDDFRNFVDELKKLGFSKLYDSGKAKDWVKKVVRDGDKYTFIISHIDKESKKAKLTINVNNKSYSYRIGFDELGTYINNYILDI